MAGPLSSTGCWAASWLGRRDSFAHLPNVSRLEDHMLLQSIKDMPVLQDGPPPGGFPSVRYARRLPSTGPTGFTLFALTTVIMAYGFVKVRSIQDVTW